MSSAFNFRSPTGMEALENAHEVSAVNTGVIFSQKSGNEAAPGTESGSQAVTRTETDLEHHYTITWDQTGAGGFKPELLAAADNFVRVREPVEQTASSLDPSPDSYASFLRDLFPVVPDSTRSLSKVPDSPQERQQNQTKYREMVKRLRQSSALPDRGREDNARQFSLGQGSRQKLQERFGRTQEHNFYDTVETHPDDDPKPQAAHIAIQSKHLYPDRPSSDSDRLAQLETNDSTPHTTIKRAEAGVPDPPIEDLYTRLAVLEVENARLRAASEIDLKNPPKSVSPSLPTYRIIYRIDDHDLYLDEPQWRRGTSNKLYLKSQMAVDDVERYLESDPAVHFVVYRDYETPEQDVTREAVLDNGVLAPPVPFEESIHITSNKLLEAMAALLESIPGLLSAYDGFALDSAIPAPYLLVYHALPVWGSGVKNLDPESSRLVNLLKDYVVTSQGKEYNAVHSELEHGLVSLKSINYLIKPGDVIVGTQEGNTVALMALSCLKNDLVTSRSRRLDRRHVILEKHQHRLSSIPDTPGPLELAEDERFTTCRIRAWSWQYDGAFAKVHTQVTIQLPLTDEITTRRISDLDFYPIQFASREVRRVLDKRSVTFWKLRVKRLVSYNRDGDDAESNTEERYMIDMKTYHKLHPDKSTKPLVSDISPGALKLDHPPQNGQEWLFPATIIAYQLSRKRWVDIDVDYIFDVRWNKTAFESLVVSDKTKEIIQALVTNQLAAKKSTDLISGKGNGLLILLHGGPGTGKTFTAEGVAEIAEKPLYRVTCGDIGTKPEAVEKYLQSVLELGKIWDCVVLLDEADVFLEERSFANLERNALVSVFLRILEYQNGIIILTSNRVGTFDAAFKSRIQLSLHYENLKAPSRRKIWRNLIKHLRDMGEEDVDYDDITDHIDDLAKEEMNGRQIRNAITTARQLAKFQKKTLNYEHLDHVIQVGAKFDKYLQDVQSGLTEDEIARSDHIR